ncbi:MAG TPA: hypothetical protein VMM92_03115 [Thermoanaerobaculia bacterium]|nr:hypothetical protein [Thermoanaerobaculia bacterium]
MAFVPLIAHLFALGTQLLLNQGNARLMTRMVLPPPRTDLERLRQELADLQGTLDETELYGTILLALVTAESVLIQDPSLGTALPESTELKPLSAAPGEDFRNISGRVYHWIRPPSALAALRTHRSDEAKTHPPDPMPHPGIYLDRLSLYWDSDPQLPRLTRVRPAHWLAPFFRDSGDDAKNRKSFKLALCPLEGSFHPRFAIQEGGAFFQADPGKSMAGGAKLQAHLEEVLEAADQEQVNLILFPELTVDEAAKRVLQGELHRRSSTWSPLYGVVAGSFHCWDGSPSLPPVNRATFLGRTGETAMCHDKKGRFRVPASKVSPQFFGNVPPGPLPKEIFEDIRYGSELAIFETTLGRIALLICADAIVADDRGYLPLIRRLRPDLLLVISMSDETEPFEAFAEEMSRYWIGTVFLNAHCVLKAAAGGGAPSAPQPPLLATWNLALYQDKGCPSTLGEWRLGQEPRSRHFRNSGRSGWYPLSEDDPGLTGVSSFQGVTNSLGLVLDLGVHWSKTEKGK